MEDCMKYQLLIIFLLGLSLGTAWAGANATDISGTWTFSISMEDPSGPQNAASTFVFEQKGEKLTGAQSAGSGELKVTGTVKGNKVEFGVEGKSRSGEPFKNTFTGTIESPTKMSGAVKFIKGPAKWTATKK
jgi:hypothetical protein